MNPLLTGPLFIGPGNALAVTGIPWRRVRDSAVALGVATVRVGKATLVPAAAFVGALEAQRAQPIKPSRMDPTTELRRRLGLVRVVR